MSDLPTGTITLLFTDMEGSTRLLLQLGERYASVLADCRGLLRAAFAEYHGHEVDTQGDAFLVAFARSTDAVQAAVEAQRRLAAHSWPQEASVRVRMGLHTGEPQRSSEGYIGLDVHHAARITSAGHGGQILLSQTTRDLVAQALPDGIGLQDLGEYQLKDFQQPIRLFQLVIAGLPADFPRLRAAGNASWHHVPVQPTTFIGREREVTMVCELLHRAGVRLLTLSGPGGVGKTRLGLQVAAELADYFPDGVVLVPLASVTDLEQVLPVIIQTLSISERGEQAPLALLTSALKDKRLLLFLDNCEQVVAAAGQLVQLLAACPGLKLLVTSQVVLRVQAEHEFVVPPLAVPIPNRLPDLVTLSQCEAVALFIQRAQMTRPDFALTDANARAVAEICVRLDGLPLAIELAAARTKYFSPQALLSRLEQSLLVLGGGARDLPARQQTLRGALVWSYGLLSPGEQRLFQRLAVFVDGCTVEAAEEVCQAGGELAVDVLEGLLSLVDKSLLRQQETTEGEVRFWMLQVLREFGLELLASVGETEPTRQAHAVYYLRLAEEAFPVLMGPQPTRWVERLAWEYANLRTALTWWLERAEGAHALRLARALGQFWLYHTYWQEGRDLLEQVLALSPAEETLVRAEALGSLGMLLVNLGELRRAEEVMRQSLIIARAIGNSRMVAASLHGLGIVALQQCNYAVAHSLLEECVALSRKQGDLGGSLYALLCLEEVCFSQGELAHASSLAEECLLLCTGERRVDKSTVLYRLGQIAFEQGDMVRARTLAEEGLALFREAGDASGTCASLRLVGKVEARQGNYVRAWTCYEQSVRIAREKGFQWDLACGLEGLAGVIAVQGELAWAARLWGMAEALREEMGTPLPLIERAGYDQARTMLRARLGEQGFAAAWTQGRAIVPEQALVALAAGMPLAELPPA